MSKNIINQRFINCVNFLIEAKKVPSKSFLAEKFNISSSKFSEILKERMNVGVDILMILTSEFGISSEWLLTGKGEMLKELAQPIASSSQPQENDNEVVALLKENNANLKKINALQEEKIKGLEREITNLEKDLQQHKKTAQPAVSDILHQPTR